MLSTTSWFRRLRVVYKSCPTLSPGPPIGLHVTEVRKNSLVLLWEPPKFTGRSGIIGYYVDMKEAGAGDGSWRGINGKATSSRYLQVWPEVGSGTARGGLWRYSGTDISVRFVWVEFTNIHLHVCPDCRTEGRSLLRVPCVCSEPCRSWTPVSAHSSHPGPDSSG